MITLLYLAGIISIIGGLVFGLLAGPFTGFMVNPVMGFIAAFVGGVLTSLIFFALAKILDNQKYISDSLKQPKNQSPHCGCEGNLS